MLNSLKAWLQNSISVLKFASSDGAGDVTFEQEVVDKVSSDKVYVQDCYLLSKITTVVDAKGQEVISMIQVFLDGTETFNQNLTNNDVFVLGTKKYGVKAISDYYMGGCLSLRVVYI